MGFGDPYHKHPLSRISNPIDYMYDHSERVNCFHCKRRILDNLWYGCKGCNFYIHKFCSNFPETMRHHLHHQHPLTLLTLFASSSSDAPTANLCNECQEPCSGGFAYHCHSCQFILHAKCCFNHNLEMHRHPLRFETSYGATNNCKICGYRINTFSFGCTGCNFFIHYDCSFFPPKIKHHHIHELTIRYDFPGECEQVYCDMCEDRDGKLDRTMSYYYCKECDYIAHVLCVTHPKEDTMLFKRFTHEHPLRFAPKDLLCCNQCDYSVDIWSREYPSLIKHPRHPEHTLTVVQRDRLSKCTNCEFTLAIYDTIRFVHPYTAKRDFSFCTDSKPFRCNICGELGIGSRMEDDFDAHLHLECFALPGKLEHESHAHHPLYLSSNPEEKSSFAPTCQYCNVCNEEIDQKVWIYCCLDCCYVAHLNCVANDLLSTLRSSIKNEPGFCAIIEPDKTSFELHIAKIDPSSSNWPPEPLLRKPVKSKEEEDDDDDAKRFADMIVEEVDGVVCCPRCNLRISVRAKD